MDVAIFDLNGIFIRSPLLGNRFLQDFGVSAEEFLPVLKETMDIVRRPDAPSAYSLWKPHLDR